MIETVWWDSEDELFYSERGATHTNLATLLKISTPDKETEAALNQTENLLRKGGKLTLRLSAALGQSYVSAHLTYTTTIEFPEHLLAEVRATGEERFWVENGYHYLIALSPEGKIRTAIVGYPDTDSDSDGWHKQERKSGHARTAPEAIVDMFRNLTN